MQIDAADAARPRVFSIASAVTMEHLLFGIVLLLAAILRLARLDAIPLSPLEAGEAWRVWAFWQPAADFPDTLPGSPAYFSLTALLTQILGFADPVMRLVPALFGVATVWLTWWLRPLLGRAGVLVAALLLAVSPTLVAAARSAGGSSLAICAVTLLFIGWFYAGENPRWWALMAPVLGVGLASDPLFYSGLAALAAVIFLQNRIEGPGRPESQIPWERLWLPLAIAFLASATLLLWYLPGIGLAAGLPARWLAAFDWSGGLRAWVNPLLALVRYEFPVLLPALPVALWAIWRGHEIGSRLSYWLLAFLGLVLIQSGTLGNLSLLVLPAYLLNGLAVSTLLATLQERGNGFVLGGLQLAGLLLVLAAVIAANINRFARLSLYDPADIGNLALAILCLLIALVVWLTLLIWERPVGLLAGMLAVLVVAVVVNWNGAWRLGTWGGSDTRDVWIAEAADPELPYLVRTMTEAARALKGETAAVTVTSAVDRPLLRWYLRDFNVTWGEAVPVGELADFVLAPAETDPTLGADYLGSNFRIQRDDQPNLLPFMAGLRWWLFGESPWTISGETITLWIRADLVTREGS